jgi:hypothetical protein
LRSANAFLVGLPFFSIAPLTPDILAQKLLRLFASLLPAFNLDGGVVTAILSLLPGLALLYFFILAIRRYAFLI